MYKRQVLISLLENSIEISDGLVVVKYETEVDVWRHDNSVGRNQEAEFNDDLKQNFGGKFSRIAENGLYASRIV